ncbi:MAG: glycerol kinase GlpK [Flavobacteriales bacterium]|jgi:glycerol kinase|nr:glycerol kinase GlpK [Flavobacteriales bacterium]
MKYIIAIDQGTTSCRAILFDQNGEVVGVEQEEFTQIFPKSGWVEHNPNEILSTQLKVLTSLIEHNSISPETIDSIGITNQRETVVAWNKTTGEPIYNAIVWQDKRTAAFCEELKTAGYQDYFKQTTGLFIDSYFSGTKIHWLLKNCESSEALLRQNHLIVGTIDTWLIWNLTNAEVHATDYSNASRTLLFDINTLDWDQKALDLMEIPKSILPQVKNSSDNFGFWEYKGVKIPIRGVIGDQQGALFGQGCFEVGDAKNTYGTGCFMLMNTGSTQKVSQHGLINTIAWGIDGKIEYALEGSIFIAGAAVQWLRDGIKIIESSSETEVLANSIEDDSDVVVVPAFAGLGAPYWDMYARGAIFGLTRDTGIPELAKATLESLAFQSKDVLKAMEKDAGVELKTLNVDGGATANNYLMQFQADILNTPVVRPKTIESTALGAAYMAGLHTGFWKMEDLKKMKQIDQTFTQKMDPLKVEKKYSLWQKAVKRSMNWIEN